MEISNKEIKVSRELSNLDKFAINFCNVIDQLMQYVIVNGYVSILLGRTRGSEDIDMLIPEIDEKEWAKIHQALEKAGYECINAGTHDSFSYLRDGIAVRFLSKVTRLFAPSSIAHATISASVNLILVSSPFTFLEISDRSFGV